MNNVCIISPAMYSYVQNDIDLLSKRYNVQYLEYHTKPWPVFMLHTLKLLTHWSQNKSHIEAVLIWFADIHSFLPLLLYKWSGANVVLIIGGYDACKFPEYRYGAHLKKWRSALVKWCCLQAHSVLAVSDYTKQNLLKNIKINHLPTLQVVHNTATVSCVGQEKKQNIVVCVAKVPDRKTLIIKGVDVFLKVAGQMPQYEFLLIGVMNFELEELKNAPSNLSMTEVVQKHTLMQVLSKSKVVCQFSRVESFGIALLEGMLHNNVPVAMSFTGSAEVVNPDFGFLLPDFDLAKAAFAVEQAMQMQPVYGEKNKEWALKNFSNEQRLEKLTPFLNASKKRASKFV